MTEPKDMILPLLRELRDEMKTGFQSVDSRLGRVEERLIKIEAAQKSFRQAMTTDTLMSKIVLGDFEERLATLEQGVEIITSPKG
ncbi:hypothetical protein [Alsobacter sp. SYSU BS001988]|jgi:hypothetical protein